MKRVGTGLLAVWLWGICLWAVARLAASFPFGLEGSDEGSYLLFAANPWASPGLGLFYGFLLHPLRTISGQSGAGFRWAGLLILAAGVGGLALALIRFLRGAEIRRWRLILVPSLLLAGFVHYTRGIRTPGYDWTILVGALVFCAGWLSLESNPKGKLRHGGEFLVAAGLVLLAAGKWLVLPGYILLLILLLPAKYGRGEFGPTLGRISLWGLLLAAVFIEMCGWKGLVDTWKAGVVYGHSSDRQGLGAMYVGWLAGYCWVLLRGLLWVAALYFLFWWMGRMFLRKRPEKTLVASAVFFLALILVLVRGHGQGGFETWGKASMFAGVWLIGTGIMAWPFLSFPRSWRRCGASPNFRLGALFLLVPMVNAAGTLTGVTNYFAHGSVFWVAAGWLVLAKATARGLAGIGLLAAMFFIGTIHAARIASTPDALMRVGFVWGADTVVETGPEKGKLRLHPSSVQALSKIDEVLRVEGFQAGDPLVAWNDLCGLVYLLGGTSPGCSWYLGGVSNHLENIPPEILSRSWFLLREGVEEPAVLWPRCSRVSLPIAVDAALAWPAGDGEGMLRPLRLYRPAVRPGGS